MSSFCWCSSVQVAYLFDGEAGENNVSRGLLEARKSAIRERNRYIDAIHAIEADAKKRQNGNRGATHLTILANVV